MRSLDCHTQDNGRRRSLELKVAQCVSAHVGEGLLGRESLLYRWSTYEAGQIGPSGSCGDGY